MEFQVGKTQTRKVEQFTSISTPQQLFELGLDVPSGKWVFQLEWVLKKFQVGKHKSKLGWVDKRGNAFYIKWKPPQNE